MNPIFIPMDYSSFDNVAPPTPDEVVWMIVGYFIFFAVSVIAALIIKRIIRRR